MESRYSRLPLPSQMWIPLSCGDQGIGCRNRVQESGASKQAGGAEPGDCGRAGALLWPHQQLVCGRARTITLGCQLPSLPAMLPSLFFSRRPQGPARPARSSPAPWRQHSAHSVHSTANSPPAAWRWWRRSQTRAAPQQPLQQKKIQERGLHPPLKRLCVCTEAGRKSKRRPRPARSHTTARPPADPPKPGSALMPLLPTARLLIRLSLFSPPALPPAPPPARPNHPPRQNTRLVVSSGKEWRRLKRMVVPNLE